MVLPHLFRSKKYLSFYQTRSEFDDFIILDNGAAEGFVYGHKHLFTLAEEVGASEIVVPDVMGDANETLALAQHFARFARPEYQYMFVLQGKTPEEVMFCLRALDNGNMFMYVTTIGIPRHLSKINKYFRQTLTDFMIKEHFNDKFEIHFLGANEWMGEVFSLADIVKGLDGFRGIDTSLPIYMGLENLNINIDDYIERPTNFFTRSDNNVGMIETNIETYLTWARYER